MSTYKGALRSKRKNELVEIAHALGLPCDEEKVKRDDVELIVKNHLIEFRSSLQHDTTWKGIYASMDQSDKRAARSSSIALSPDSDASDDGTRKHTVKAGRTTLTNGVRRTSIVANEGAANIANAFTAKARRSFEDLTSAFRSGAVGVRDEVREEVADAAEEVGSLGNKVLRVFRSSGRKIESRSQALVHRWRFYLSDAQHITGLLLILEATLLLLQIMPFTTIKLGQSHAKTIVKQAVGKTLGSGGIGSSVHLPRIVLSVPNLWALLTYQFWRPVLLWNAWTVLIPLVASNLITFDRKNEPSSLTFNLVRLALLSALNKTSLFTNQHIPQMVGVVAGEARQASASWMHSSLGQIYTLFSYEFVAPFVNVDFQLLATSLATAFAAYEVVANRPRAVA